MTLPIYIGNLPISSPSVAPARPPPPIPADAPVPQPRVRSHTVTPTAPPADELATPAAAKTRAPQVKSCHSSPGLRPPVSPRTFRHTPHQGHSQSLRDRAHSSAGPMEDTIHFSGRNSTPVPTNRASAMQNRTNNYPQGDYALKKCIFIPDRILHFFFGVILLYCHTHCHEEPPAI